MAKRKKQYVIREPEQIEALVSPFRHHLLRTLSSIGPASVRTLARAVGRSPESLYYHLHALEEAGLVVDASEPGGEATFDAVAQLILSDPDADSPEYLDAYARSVASLLRMAGRQVERELHACAEEGRARSRSFRAQQVQVRLSAAKSRELRKKLDDVVAFLYANDDPDGAEPLAVTLVAAPIRRG